MLQGPIEYWTHWNIEPFLHETLFSIRMIYFDRMQRLQIRRRMLRDLWILIKPIATISTVRAWRDVVLVSRETNA